MKNFFITTVVILAVSIFTQAVSAQGPFQPLKEHGLLKKDVGVWEAKGKMFIPGAPAPMEFAGEETNEMLGDLFVITDFRGNFGGMDFRGHGRLGFNPETKKFESTWFDVTNPWAMTGEATYHESTKTLTTETKSKDPATGNDSPGKSTMEYKDDDTRVMTAYNVGADGEMVKTMEITYTRKK